MGHGAAWHALLHLAVKMTVGVVGSVPVAALSVGVVGVVTVAVLLMFVPAGA